MKFCITCKYWDKDEAKFSDGNRECHKLTNELLAEHPFLSCATGDESDPFITTNCSFGCVFHEER